MDIFRKPHPQRRGWWVLLYTIRKYAKNIEAKNGEKIGTIWVPFTRKVTPNNVFLYSLISFFLNMYI